MKKNMHTSNQHVLSDEWFEKAYDDIRAAEVLLAHKEGPMNIVCFHAQQSAEKYLKGYLVYAGKRFPKIHYLVKLLELCEKYDPTFMKLRKDAKTLSQFYIATRYPADYPSFDFVDAKRAFEQAVRIKDFIFDKVY